MVDKENIERYTMGEEIANSVTHGVGALLSIAGLVLLIVFSAFTANSLTITSFTIYGASLFLLYLISTLYHAIQHKKTKFIFEIMDHSAIYLLIAGTYTPFCLVSLKGALGWTIFGIVWGCAALGIVFKIFFVKKFMFLSTLMYILMGWMVVFALKPLIAATSKQTIIFLVIGGLFYTFGAIFYVWRKVKYHHMVWHLFVLAGSVFHYFSVLSIL
ncbi:MAG TPA: hemolysin III family protein [Fervidobacterium sp.]|nr:hemolysin III family protein [Fervidobacterium sp.]